MVLLGFLTIMFFESFVFGVQSFSIVIDHAGILTKIKIDGFIGAI
jgi:hypothetical protein